MAVRMLLTVKWSLIVPTEATRSSGQNRDRGYVIEYYSAAESLPSAMSFQSMFYALPFTVYLAHAFSHIYLDPIRSYYLAPQVA